MLVKRSIFLFTVEPLHILFLSTSKKGKECTVDYITTAAKDFVCGTKNKPKGQRPAKRYC